MASIWANYILFLWDWIILTDKDYERAVKCFFVCTESLADIDLVDPSFKYFSRIRAARCYIMHIHTVTTMPKFASRCVIQLNYAILLKTCN